MENIKKTISGLGDVEIRPYLTIRDIRDAEDLIDQSSKEDAPNIFTNFIVSISLVSPKLTVEDVNNLSPDTLIEIVETILADLLEIQEEFDDASDITSIKDRFLRAYLENEKKLYKEFSESIQKNLKPFRELAETTVKQSGIYEALNQFGNVVEKLGIVSTQNTFADKFPGMIAFLNAMVEPMQNIMKDVVKFNLPEPFLSNALIASNINSPIIHSPTYEILPISIPNTEEGLAESAKDAHRRRLVDAYDILSNLELSLREFIEASLSEIHQGSWWKRAVPEDVRKDCEQRKAEKEKPKGASHHPLSYAYVHDYRKIIMRGDNWKQVFSKVFDNKTELEASFNWVSNVRDAVAHTRPISDDDYLMFTAGAHWLQSRIKLT